MRLICFLLIFCLFNGLTPIAVPASSLAKENDIQKVLKQAVKTVNGEEFTWIHPESGEKIKDKINISIENIVIIDNMDDFCAKKNVATVSECDKLKRFPAFVLGSTFPIYINNDPNIKNVIDDILREFKNHDNVVLMLAGMLVHEHTHTQKIRKEEIACAREWGFLQQVILPILEDSEDPYDKHWYSIYAKNILTNVTGKEDKGLKVVSKN